MPAVPVNTTDPEQTTRTASTLFSLNPRVIWRALCEQPRSFWCACGYLVFEYVRPQSIYTSLEFLPWPVVFLALTFIFAEQERQKWLPSGGITTGLIVMSVVVLMSSFAALNPGLSFSHWRDFYNWIIIYFVVRRAVNTEVKLFLFIALFFLANIKMTQHGFLTWAARGFSFAHWGVTGAPGWFENSGEFGIEICVFLPMLLGVYLALGQQWSRTTHVIIGLVFLTGLGSAVASSSRGALVGLGAAAAWMTMRNKYVMQRFVRASIALTIVGWLIYVNIPDEFMTRFAKTGDDAGSLHRLERWRAGWETIKTYPLLGVGMKNWEPYYISHYNPEIKGSVLVHNIFVEAGTELGFLGLGAFCWLLWTIFRVNSSVRRIVAGKNAPFLIGLSYGLDGSTVGMLTSCFFVTVFYYPFVWIQCLMASCLYAVAITQFPPTVAVKPKRSRFNPIRSAHRVDATE